MSFTDMAPGTPKRPDVLSELASSPTASPTDVAAYEGLFDYLGGLVDTHGHEPYIRKHGQVPRLGGWLKPKEVVVDKAVSLPLKTGALVTARAVFEPHRKGAYDNLRYATPPAVGPGMVAESFPNYDNFYCRPDDYASLVVDRIVDPVDGTTYAYAASTGYRRNRAPVYNSDFVPVRTLFVGRGAGQAVMRSYSSSGHWNGLDQQVEPDGTRQLHAAFETLVTPSDNGYPDMHPTEPRFDTVPDLSPAPWQTHTYSFKPVRLDGWAPIGELSHS